MKATIKIFKTTKQVRDAYQIHYGEYDQKPTRKQLQEFLSALVEYDLEAIMCTNQTAIDEKP